MTITSLVPAADLLKSAGSSFVALESLLSKVWTELPVTSSQDEACSQAVEGLKGLISSDLGRLGVSVTFIEETSSKFSAEIDHPYTFLHAVQQLDREERDVLTLVSLERLVKALHANGNQFSDDVVPALDSLLNRPDSALNLVLMCELCASDITLSASTAEAG